MTKKKILFVSPYFKPHTGGLENYVSNIEKGLRDLDWETVVVTSNEKGRGFQEEIIDGVKVYRLPTLFKISNTPINPLWYFYLKKILKNEKPDIINGHAPVPFISDMAALASGTIPFVLTYHAGSMKKGKLIFDVIIWLYEHILLTYTASKAERIICPSQFVIDTVLKRFKQKATVITPGVDTSLFKPAEGNGGEKNTVLFIARFANMYKMKGLYNLIEAVKTLPQVTLKVIGEPIFTDAKNVVFLGTKSIQETVREMQNCTLLALPSLAHYESFGMVLIEAMACKKPVIGTMIGGIPEVIENRVDGILVPSGDIPALTSAIESIMNHPEFAESLAERGFEKVAVKYTWQKKVEETNEEFSRLVGAKQ